MAHASELIAENIEEYLTSHQYKSLLRFITCGSVDDGKSTLIGRLLYESHLVFEDHLAALEADSAKVGTQGGDLDFALLLDGLTAEHEQGITIDVAYRFFSTERRKFIVADTPGHEQYTRNMVTGASTADVAVILVDARKGILTQTRRHSFLVSLLGIKRVVVAINKMDLVDYSADVFGTIAEEYLDFAERVGLDDVTFIPLSALKGDNIIAPSDNTPWYQGPTLLGYLETVPVDDELADGAFRMPVQWVNRPNLDFRGFSGRIVGGTVRPGDTIRVLPSGTTSTIERIVTMDGDLDEAIAGQSVTLTLADEIDASRGDLICGADTPAEVADQFEAHVVWMHEDEMLPGRPYLMKIGTRTVGATIAHPKYRVDVNTLEHLAANTLEMNEIGVCNVSLDRPIPFDAYDVNRDTGGFIIIDKLTNVTVGAGLLHFALRRSHNIHWQDVKVDKAARAGQNNHGPAVVWLTGLSGSGKSTIANIVESKLHALGVRTYLLDGDNVRHGLNRDLGFTDADRVENIRRIAEVSKLMVDAGLVVLVSFISPFRAERRLARDSVEEGEFIEVHVDTPLAVAEGRDPKGLYTKARRGELANFTGIDSPYEPPEHPEVHIDTAATPAEQAADEIVAVLRQRNIVSQTFPVPTDAWITLVVLVVVFAALATERVSTVAGLGAAVGILLLTDVVDQSEALSGLASSAPLTIAALYVLAGAATVTGALSPGIDRLMAGKRFGAVGQDAAGANADRGRLARLTLSTTVMSAFLPNTPLVAFAAPRVVTWCRRAGISAAPYLMPLSYAAVIGGVITVIGTSTNLVVSDLLVESGEKSLGIFEITPVGLPVALVAVIVLTLTSHRLLGGRGMAESDDARIADTYTLAIRVQADSPLVGHTVEEAGLRSLQGVFLAGIERGGRIVTVRPETLIGADDVCYFAGDVNDVVDVLETPGLVSAEEPHLGDASERVDAGLYEVVVAERSELAGSTLSEVGFRAHYDAAVLAIKRHDDMVPGKLGTVVLRPGDVLLVLATPQFEVQWRGHSDFSVIASLDTPPPPRRAHGWVVLVAIAAMITVAVLNVLDLMEAALVAAALLVVFRIISVNEARRSINVNVVLTIALSVSLGTAVSVSGLATEMASVLSKIGDPFGDVGKLVAVLVATMVLTELLSNNAAAAVMLPIATAVAADGGLDPRSMAIVVLIGASCSYLSPIGYQTNLMVYSLGGYRFTDFTRLGAPLTVVTLVVTPIVVPLTIGL